MMRLALGFSVLVIMAALTFDSFQPSRGAAGVRTGAEAPPSQSAGSDCGIGEARLPETAPLLDASVVLRVDYPEPCPSSGQLSLRPGLLRLTDGATGTPLPEWQPLNAGRGVAPYAFSPDGRLLAFAATSIHIIDLSNWTEVATVAAPSSPFQPLLWSPDSSRVYFFGSEHKDRRVWAIEVNGGSIRRLPDLPFDSLTDGALTRDGRVLYGLASDLNEMGPTTGGWSVKGEPYVSGVEVETGREVIRLPLPGLQIGDGNDYARRRPAAVLDEEAGRMYVVHVDSDAISVVDLRSGRATEAGSVASRAARAPSLPTRLLNGLSSLLVSGAEAKGNGQFWRQAELSKDGTRLLISGWNESFEDGKGLRQPTGLRVIDTASMREMYREDGIESFVQTADGAKIAGFGYGWTSEHETEYEGSGLKVIDTATGRLLAHLNPERAYTSIALSLDGRYLHAVAKSPEVIALNARGIWSCTSPCVSQVVDIIDLPQLRAIGTYSEPMAGRNLVGAGPK